MKVTYYVNFKAGFKEYASSAMDKLVATGEATQDLRWTVFDSASGLLALPAFTVAYLLF